MICVLLISVTIPVSMVPNAPVIAAAIVIIIIIIIIVASMFGIRRGLRKFLVLPTTRSAILAYCSIILFSGSIVVIIVCITFIFVTASALSRG